MQSRCKQVFTNILRNIFINHQRTTHVKHLSSLNISANSRNDPNSNPKRRSFTKYLIWFSSGLTCYYLLKTRSIVPSVEAAINLSGRRGQFNFISDVVEQSAPSVVYIEIKDMKRFDFFTGVPLTASNGSGFIIKEDGLILTNAHVVVNKPNSRIDVRLHDGTTHVGTLETVDMDSDLALIRINKTNLPVMKLGKSKDMRPGEFVVAIGSPLSLSNTCTCGVVSNYIYIYQNG